MYLYYILLFYERVGFSNNMNIIWPGCLILPSAKCGELNVYKMLGTL